MLNTVRRIQNSACPFPQPPHCFRGCGTARNFFYGLDQCFSAGTSSAGGTDAAINYRTTDFEEEVRKMSSGLGVDLIQDMIGGDYFTRNVGLLANEGRLIQISLQSGAHSEIDLRELLMKRITLT